MHLLKLEDEMPDFKNHEQAKQWFKTIFHNDFIIRSSDTWWEENLFVSYCKGFKTISTIHEELRQSYKKRNNERESI